MLRNAARVTILLLIAHALYRFVPVYVHYQQFKDAVAEAALFAKDRTDIELVDQIMVLAERHQIPLDREAVQISRERLETIVTLQYDERIEWVPTYARPMTFTVSAEGWQRRPGLSADPSR